MIYLIMFSKLLVSNLTLSSLLQKRREPHWKKQLIKFRTEADRIFCEIEKLGRTSTFVLCCSRLRRDTEKQPSPSTKPVIQSGSREGVLEEFTCWTLSKSDLYLDFPMEVGRGFGPHALWEGPPRCAFGTPQEGRPSSPRGSAGTSREDPSLRRPEGGLCGPCSGPWYKLPTFLDLSEMAPWGAAHPSKPRDILYISISYILRNIKRGQTKQTPRGISRKISPSGSRYGGSNRAFPRDCPLAHTRIFYGIKICRMGRKRVSPL